MTPSKIRIALLSLALVLAGATRLGLACPGEGMDEVPRQEMDHDGFLHPGSTAQQPGHLPANAAGVLFQGPISLRASDFSITRLDTGAQLPATLRSLPEAVQALAGRDTRDPEPGFAGPLYRVGPSAGFVAGARYRIAGPAPERQAIFVQIDAAVIDTARLGVSLTMPIQPNREPFDFGGFCRFSPSPALIVGVDYQLPPALAPYRARLFSRMGTADEDGLREVTLFLINHWHMAPRGRDPLLPGLQTRLYGTVIGGLPPGKVIPGLQARLAFLEIDDRISLTPALPTIGNLDAIPARDSLDYLQAALRSKHGEQLASQLEQLPVRGTDAAYNPAQSTAMPGPLAELYRRQRQYGLIDLLARLMAHPDPAIRWRASDALERVVTWNGPSASIVNRVAGIMQKALQDEDRTVQEHARKHLMALTAFVRDTPLLCSRSRYPVRLSSCVDQRRLQPRWPGAPSPAARQQARP